MPDIQLRFNKDILVLSSPIQSALSASGMDTDLDNEYTILFEPEVIEEIYKLESMTGVQCLVADTSTLTPARLTSVGMRESAEDLARAALKITNDLNPQHTLVEIAPCMLPLDEASKNSLIENKNQYMRAARLFDGLTFDAFFLNGFVRCADLKCALMGIRSVSDKPIFASVDLDTDAMLARFTDAEGKPLSGSERNTESFEEALSVMVEYGADVVGFASASDIEKIRAIVEKSKSETCFPLLVQLYVKEADPQQEAPTPENPYYSADTMSEASDVLCDAGVQFLRACGDATPSYTGVLVAETDKLEVHGCEGVGEGGSASVVDLDEMASRLRERVSAAMGKIEQQ